jgi:hypothetical protein
MANSGNDLGNSTTQPITAVSKTLQAEAFVTDQF